MNLMKNKKGSFREMLITTLLIGLFAFALINFAFQSASDNNSNIFSTDPTLNKSFYDINKSLSSYQSIAETQLNATTEETPTLGYGSLLLFSIIYAGRTFTIILKEIPLIIMNLVSENLHIPPIVFGVIITIIFISIIFYSWRLFRSGE